jgi:hypothetical protein
MDGILMYPWALIIVSVSFKKALISVINGIWGRVKW